MKVTLNYYSGLNILNKQDKLYYLNWGDCWPQQPAKRQENTDRLVVLQCDTRHTHLISRVKRVAGVPTCTDIALSVSHYNCLVSDSTI